MTNGEIVRTLIDSGEGTAIVKDAIYFEQGTPEWLKWRLNGITATEASAAIGASKWSSPLEVYRQKLNPEPHEPSKYEEWGTLLEDTIKFGKFAKAHPEFEVRQGMCYEDEWRKCSLDGELYQDGKCVAILEIKTGRDISVWDPIPEYYKAQVMWQMRVTGIRRVYFAVLINGCDYLERVIDYDPQYAEELEMACAKLWQCICTKTLPPATKPDIDQDIINAEAVNAPDDKYELTDDEVAAFVLARDKYQKAELAFKNIKMKISEHFKDAKRLTYKGAIFGTFIQMAGKTTIDSKLLKKEYPEVYEKVAKLGKPVSYPKFM